MALSTVLILLSALLCFASFPPIGIPWLMPVALLPLIHVLVSLFHHSIRRHTIITYCIPGFLFGLFYMGITNYWLFYLREFSSLPMLLGLYGIYTIFQSLFFSLVSLLYYLSNRCLWVLPFTWAALEWFKSLGHFGSTNGVLGYSQVPIPSIAFLANWGGVELVSLYCVLLNIILYKILHHTLKKKWNSVTIWLVTLSFLSLCMVKLSSQKLASSIDKTLNVALIQSNHAVSYKLNPANHIAIQKEFIEKSKILLSTHHPDLIIFPETITARFNLNDMHFITPIQALANAYQCAFIFGTPRLATPPSRLYYNSAAFVSPHAPIQYYDKQLLMPFGEYWPFKSLFLLFGLDNIIPGSDFTPGTSAHLFSYHSHNIGTAICLETTTSPTYTTLTQNGATILVSLVNNGWFKTSSIAKRQLQMAQLRAIETGRPILQAANIGHSAIINGNGEIVTSAPLFEEATIMGTIYPTTLPTPFRLLPINLGAICSGISLLFILLRRVRKKSIV